MTMLWVGAGLLLGSFVNVCIYRLPRGESLVWPGSRCPACAKPIAFYDNVPVFSFLLLRGSCRRCRKPIPSRYLLVELIVGALAGAVQWKWGQYPAWAAMVLGAAAALVVVAFIDWDTFLIPDVLSIGLLLMGLAASPFNPFYRGASWNRLGAAFCGGLAGFVLCWAIATLGGVLFKKEAMGGGDIKLLAAVGAWTGALGAFDCLILASLAGAMYGGSLLLRRRIKRQDPIPFGPFLSAGAIFNFFYLLPFGFPFHNI